MNKTQSSRNGFAQPHNDRFLNRLAPLDSSDRTPAHTAANGDGTGDVGPHHAAQDRTKPTPSRRNQDARQGVSETQSSCPRQTCERKHCGAADCSCPPCICPACTARTERANVFPLRPLTSPERALELDDLTTRLSASADRAEAKGHQLLQLFGGDGT